MAFHPNLAESLFSTVNGIKLLSRSGAETYYLDPGSGSFLLQLLAAALFGSLFIIRSNWTKLVNFFRNRFGHAPTDAEEEKDQ